MEVKHRLACFGVYVEDGAVAFLRDSHLFGDTACHCKDVRKERRVVCRHVIQRGDVFAGYDQNMDGRLGVDVMKRDDAIIFVHHLRRQFVIRNSTKETRFHRSLPKPISRLYTPREAAWPPRPGTTPG